MNLIHTQTKKNLRYRIDYLFLNEYILTIFCYYVHQNTDTILRDLFKGTKIYIYRIAKEKEI